MDIPVKGTEMAILRPHSTKWTHILGKIESSKLMGLNFTTEGTVDRVELFNFIATRGQRVVELLE